MLIKYVFCTKLFRCFLSYPCLVEVPEELAEGVRCDLQTIVGMATGLSAGSILMLFVDAAMFSATMLAVLCVALWNVGSLG